MGNSRKYRGQQVSVDTGNEYIDGTIAGYDEDTDILTIVEEDTNKRINVNCWLFSWDIDHDTNSHTLYI